MPSKIEKQIEYLYTQVKCLQDNTKGAGSSRLEYSKSSGKLKGYFTDGETSEVDVPTAYTTNLSQSEREQALVPTDWQDKVVGISKEDVNLMDISQIVDTFFFPTISAYIGALSSISYSSLSVGLTYEVGVAVTPNFIVTFNRGSIQNGDGSYAGPIAGTYNQLVVTNSGSTTYSNSSPESSQSVTMPSARILDFGGNVWTITENNSAGTTIYYDSEGVQETISEIESLKGVTTRSTSFTISGRYRYWVYQGDQDSAPINSAGVRALPTTDLMRSDNTATFEITVLSGTQSVVVYALNGTDVEIIDKNTNSNVTPSPLPIVVNDAASRAVNYESYPIYLGEVGYPQDTVFEINIT